MTADGDVETFADEIDQTVRCLDLDSHLGMLRQEVCNERRQRVMRKRATTRNTERAGEIIASLQQRMLQLPCQHVDVACMRQKQRAGLGQREAPRCAA